MKAFIVISTLIFSSMVIGQPSMNEAATSFSQQGQLFTIKIVPGEEAIKLFVVGTKAADIRKTLYGVEASIYAGKEVKTLVVTPKKGHYLIQRPKTAKELKLRLRSSAEMYEDFRIPLAAPQ